MNRSNVGNIITNAMQTLNISATTASGFKRSIDRADLALNAQEGKRANMEARTAKLESQTAKAQAQTKITEEKAKQEELKTEQMKLKNEGISARTERTKQIIEKNKPITIDELLEDNSEQVPHIKTKINNDIDYLSSRKQLITSVTEADWEKAVEEFKKQKGGE